MSTLLKKKIPAAIMVWMYQKQKIYQKIETTDERIKKKKKNPSACISGKKKRKIILTVLEGNV